jgi:hypothetical protein
MEYYEMTQVSVLTALLRLQWWSTLVGVCLFASSCFQGTPSAPTGEAPVQSEFTSGALRSAAEIKLRKQATLLDDVDGSVIVTLHARCPNGFQVIEGPVTLSQGPVGRETIGEGFFTTRCNGRWQLQRVRVVAPEGLERGRANASASMDLEDPATGEFLQASDNEVVKIR